MTPDIGAIKDTSDGRSHTGEIACGGPMNNADRFRAVERLVSLPEPPSWEQLCAEIDMPDQRWREHDPRESLSALREAWADVAADWTQARVLWLGIESDGTQSYLQVGGYAELDETDFPQGLVWRGGELPSDDLTAFAGYARGAMTRATTRTTTEPLLRGQVWRYACFSPAPPDVSILAGFGGGDWLVFRAEPA